MAYDDELANRIREHLAGGPPVDEKRMFGGLAFLIGGHIAVAASGRGGLMLRCEPADAERLVASPHVERMVMRGREMDGWLRVGVEALETDEDFARWVRVGLDVAVALPPKS